MNRSYLPTIFNELFDEILPAKEACSSKCQNSSVSLYEDENAVYVEAVVAGVEPDDIQVTFDRRGVSIEGKAVEEKSNAKYHLRSMANYSYWIPLPSGKVDEQVEPEAMCKDGIIKLTFPKSKSSKPLKIKVKAA